MSTADKMFGGILLMEFANALVTGSSQAYFVITIPFGIADSGECIDSSMQVTQQLN